MTSRPRVLVVDDKENVVRLVARILEPEFAVDTAGDGMRALALIAAHAFDVVISDIRMPGADGMAVLHEVRRQHPETEVVLMTAFGSIPAAVEAMKQGAYDYLQKPFEPEQALLVVRRAAERKQLRVQARDLRAALDHTRRFEQIVAESRPMRDVVELVTRAARSNVTVLVTGESGTGKELVARAIHAASTRAGGGFVAINCGALPEALVEAELFGHAAGAYTGAAGARAGLFEEAHGGTLLLDEIGELPLAMQVKLNRVLQERSIRRVGEATERAIDVRVTAATNVDLRAAVAEGSFREDLYYRLDVFPIQLPPLRARKEDVPLLAQALLERHRRDGQAQGFSPEALAAMVAHDWPGNVRELENAVLRALAVCEAARIAPSDLGTGFDRRTRDARPLESMSYRDVLETARDRATREYLVALMKELGGNVTQAAERAGIERESMHRLLKRYGVRSDDFKGR